MSMQSGQHRQVMKWVTAIAKHIGDKHVIYPDRDKQLGTQEPALLCRAVVGQYRAL